VWRKVKRKFWEESSGRAGNWEVRMRGVPKTASGGGGWESTWGVDQKERRKKGRCETQSEEAQQVVRVALRRRWVLLIITLD